ncbi:hypothetical protein AcidC75_29250 [Acidisoma sp. C75]
MAKPLSLDLRVRIAAALAEGLTVRAAAKRFDVSVASAVRMGQLARSARGLAARLVFIDETWVKTNMTRTRGWSLRGTPLIAKVPRGHWKTLTFLAGLRHDRIVAPCVIDGPINGISFTAWVAHFLAPTLSPGDIVIADNLGSHKGQPARQLIRSAGARLFFLPPYSPDLNPIEMMFAKLKTLLRKADERSVEGNMAKGRLTPRRFLLRRVLRIPPPRRL